MRVGGDERERERETESEGGRERELRGPSNEARHQSGRAVTGYQVLKLGVPSICHREQYRAIWSIAS